MTPDEQRILDFGQQIYLAKTGNRRELSDQEETDGFIDNTISWVNQFLPELEAEADWIYSREFNSIIGTATNDYRYPLAADVRKLPVSPYRDVTIRHDGSTVATFRLVSPDLISDPSEDYEYDRATVVDRTLVLSRYLTEAEQAGDVVADIIKFIPRMKRDDTTCLDLVQPLQLIVFGVLKNQLLTDPVKNVLVPTVTQKYGDLLRKAVAENNATADANSMPRENMGFVRGVW